MIKIAKHNTIEDKTAREVFIEQSLLLGADPNFVILSADLIYAMGLKEFGKRYPDRLIECGIMEANMMATAAGLSLRGLIPYIQTFSCFISRRALDQIYISLCYARLNAKLMGIDPGITALFNGGTHMGLEDMAHLMAIPNITLLDPSDNSMFSNIITQLKDIYGVQYIRMDRKRSTKIYEVDSTFEIGKGIVLQEGTDATIISSGLMVPQVLEAARQLKEEGISVRIVDMFTWKPLDNELICDCAAKTGAIITAENHSVINGLGAAVASVVCANRPVPMGYIGVQNHFGEVGDYDYILQQFHMDPPAIVAKVKETIQKKH